MNESLSRKEILNSIKEKKKLKSKLLLLLIIISIIIVLVPSTSYLINVWIPYQKTALKVEEKEFTRKDLVDFIRFNQRISEEQGNQFDLGSSLFQSLQLLAENEIAYLSATEYVLTVDDWEIDEAFYLKLGFYNNFESKLIKKGFQNIIIKYEDDDEENTYNNNKYILNIEGMINVDLLEYYKSNDLEKFENYKLDTIAKVIFIDTL